MIIPAIPQAIATERIFLAAAHITSIMSFPPKVGRRPFVRSTTETTIPIKRQATIPIRAAKTAVKPAHKK